MMRGQKRRGSCTVLWQLPHPPALQTTVQHADVPLRHRPTGWLLVGSLPPFAFSFIWNFINTHGAIQHYISAIQNAH